MNGLGKESARGHRPILDLEAQHGAGPEMPDWTHTLGVSRSWLEPPYATRTLPNSLAPTEGLASSGLIATSTSTGDVPRPSPLAEAIPEEPFPRASSDVFALIPRGTQAIRRLDQWPAPSAPWFIETRTEALAARSVGFGVGVSGLRKKEAITPAAEKHARDHGIYGSLLLTKEAIREIIPFLQAMYIDVKQDPDAGGYPTICFTMTTREGVDRIVDADGALRDVLFDPIPTADRMYFSLDYQFE